MLTEVNFILRMRALLTRVEQTEVQQAIICISNNNDRMLLNYLFQAATLKHWVRSGSGQNSDDFLSEGITPILGLTYTCELM